MLASPDSGIPQQLSRLAKVRQGILGSAVTTYNIGGPLSVVVEPDSEEELKAVLRFLHIEGIRYRVLGAGSNILINDQGISDIVIRLGRGFRGTTNVGRHGNTEVLEVGAAAALMTLSRTVSDQGLSGLEFAGGIPATIGGAVSMNAGAHGGEIASVLLDVKFIRDGNLVRVRPAELPFQYRHSGIEPGAVITGVTMALVPGDKEVVAARRAENLKERKLRQPLTVPSAGSVFKNPSPEKSAGRVIEECGLKGAAIGGAQVSPLHGNWIINPERRATAADVGGLMKLCIDTVASRTGITLEPEVLKW